MKRTLLAIIAAAISIVACNKTEVLDTNRQAIAFGEAFVDNATKAAIDGSYSGTKTLTTFNVWGSVTGNGNTVNVFDGATCSGQIGDEVWGCNQTQYWLPSCSYNFIALVDADLNNGLTKNSVNMPTAIAFDSNGEKDLLIATASTSTNDAAEPGQNPVEFTFRHLLSKAFFTFKNEAGGDNYAFEITDISVLNIHNSGVYTIGADVPWAVTGGVSSSPLSFGNAVYENDDSFLKNGKSATSTNARTFIPTDYGAGNKFKVSFKANMVYKGEVIGSKTHEIEVQHTFAINSSYNFIIKLGAGSKITFTVNELEGWGEVPEIEIH